MKRQPPPLRFVALVVGLWVCGRTAMLAPDWWVEPGVAAPVTAPKRARDIVRANAVGQPSVDAARPPARKSAAPLRIAATPNPAALPVRPAPPLLPLDITLLPVPTPAAVASPRSLSPRYSAPPARPGRWSASAWLLLRDDRSGSLAHGGTLGGSQSGVRVAWRLNGDPARPVALSARLYAPLRNRSGAEAALGLDWRPLRSVPVHILAERRQALGRDGRSAFSIALHGGVSEQPLPAGLRLDAYGQAGIVGARSRDLFADGAARVSLPAGRVSVGAGLWGGAQPGASRLDAGPSASIRLPLAGESVRLTADWRFRVAGDARPGSGPVLTLGSDF
jgi:hypothetical protein